MRTPIRFTLLVLATVGLASGFAIHSAAGAPTEGNHFEATFTETNASITNRIADLGILQLINTGTGNVDGYGSATSVIAVTQDRSVQPCGPGSWTNAGIRRIAVDAGVLVFRTVAYVCQTATGPKVSESWTVDGPASTGAFAGARGSGEGSVDLSAPVRITTLSGKLKLAADAD